MKVVSFITYVRKTVQSLLHLDVKKNVYIIYFRVDAMSHVQMEPLLVIKHAWLPLEKAIVLQIIKPIMLLFHMVGNNTTTVRWSHQVDI